MNDVVSRLVRHAAERPDATALTVLDDPREGEARRSYGALAREAGAVAEALRAHARPGDRACLMLDTGTAYVAAFLGCLMAGVIAVPAFPPEPRRPQHQARLLAIIDDCAPALVLAHGRDRDAVRSMLGARAVAVVSAEDAAAGEPARRGTPPGPADVAFLQYTSGSTASPKGVVVSHRALAANERLIGAGFGLGAGDVMVSWLPLYHDMGLIGGLLQPLHAGFPAVLMSPRHFLARPARWLEAVSRFAATVSGGPDFAYRLVAERLDPESLAGLDLSSWRVAFSGSEMVRAETMEAFAAAAAPAGFDARAIRPCYGLAEATLFVSAGGPGEGLRALALDPQALAGGRAVPRDGGTRVVACGAAQAGHPIAVLDADGAVLPEGGIGEVVVSGPSLAEGYWRNPEASAAAFVERDGVRTLRTGDLGFVRDGRLHLVGRAKDLIIVRGQNIYPQDVERAVEDGVDLLRKGRIAAFAVERDGQEGLGVAVEVPRAARRLVAPEALAGLIAEVVGEAFLETAHVVALLEPGALPRTSSGKLRRDATRRGVAAGTLGAYAVVVGGRAAGAAQAPAPAPAAGTPTEAALRRVWSEILGRDGIGRDDHFLALGGDSVAALRALAAIRAATGLALPPEALFAHPRLSALAAEIDRRLAAGTDPLPRVPRDRPLPLSPAQERMWIEAEFGGAGHHIVGGARLAGRLDPARLEAALAGLAARHEALRTAVRRRPDGGADQVVRETGAPGLARRDLSDRAPAAREAALADLVRAEGARPFDLAQPGGGARFVLVRLAPEAHVLVVAIHHILADGWSMQVLLDDLAQLYAGATLAPLPFGPADVTAWQHGPAGLAAREAALAWWRGRLAPAAPDPGA
ncbi:AMP-binding protein, partial [Methylobacterium crusticola]